MKRTRYIIGIDLGTTNSALAYVDAAATDWRVGTLRTPQWTGPGLVEERDVLPSFHYEFAADESAGGAARLPWVAEAAGFAVGTGARDRGAEAPGRLITSAKSWLCHAGIDRTAAVLPWRGASGEKQGGGEAGEREACGEIERHAWPFRRRG